MDKTRLINCVPIGSDEVLAAAEEIHKDFPGSKSCAIPTIERFTQAGWKWHSCLLTPETIVRVRVGHHRHGDVSLLPKEGGSVEQARQAFKTLADYERQAPNCFRAITAIRSTIASGQPIGFIVLHEDGN